MRPKQKDGINAQWRFVYSWCRLRRHGDVPCDLEERLYLRALHWCAVLRDR